MIPKECKRLAEVDFPISGASTHAIAEKKIRHGLPSSIHLWWARRPLASCRSVLLALLLPDPCDFHCPPAFKVKARSILKQVTGIAEGDEGLQKSLLQFVADTANWEVATHPRWIGVARDLVKAAHPEEPPLVVDPFAGGGSIPLEGLRLGCDVFASDLNPVACLIEKLLLEDIPRHGPELVEELRTVGNRVKVAAEKELREFYPVGADGGQPITYLWARTVRCEEPNCGAEIPLIRSLWLCKKSTRRRALKPVVSRPKGVVPHVEFEIFEPSSEKAVMSGTVSRAKAICQCCHKVLNPGRVRDQLAAQHGGADVIFDDRDKRVGGAWLLAVVTVSEGQTGRAYRLPTPADYKATRLAQERLREIGRKRRPDGLNLIPDEPLPPIGTLGFRVQRYGMLKWGDLYTARQKLALLTLASAAERESNEAVREALALSLSKLSELACSLCAWEPIAECTRHVFGRHALPITWDFSEGVLTSESSGSFEVSVSNVLSGISSIGSIPQSASPQLADAAASPLPSGSAAVWFTDPPYYDAIPYSDLSDFFLVWLKRALPGHPLLRDPFDLTNPLSPKVQEAVQDETKKVNGLPKDRAFFEDKMAQAFTEGRRVLHEDGIGCVVFAHKTTEGWEALLSGMIRGGWTIKASWPIVTEASNRLRARDSAALATSVHLVCRPRSEEAGVGEWAEVLRELPRRVQDWMVRLENEGVHGADLVFACIGPALEIFSRFERVETAEGDPVTLEVYLRKVWEVVGRTALERVLGTPEANARNGGAGALEEDARLTALFLWTVQSSEGDAEAAVAAVEEGDTDDATEADEEESKDGGKGLPLIYDVVRRFAQPLGIHLETWEGRIIVTNKGIVRLLPVSERAKQLFGQDGASAVADLLENSTGSPKSVQPMLFPVEDERPQLVAPKKKGRRKTVDDPEPTLQVERKVTTLDRVHAAMLLQASGRTNALRALLKEEIDRGPDFIRLANSLAKLYPDGSEEQRLVRGMLLAVPR